VSASDGAAPSAQLTSIASPSNYTAEGATPKIVRNNESQNGRGLTASIKVVVRVRPLLYTEIGSAQILHVNERENALSIEED
jgi:hypothetical protein